MKTVLIINTYNRPEYLQRCLASVEKCADELRLLGIMVVVSDDRSTNPRAVEIVNTWRVDGVWQLKFTYKQNQGIAVTLRDTLTALQDFDFEYYITLDSDAVIAEGFLTRAVQLAKKYPRNVCSLFNCEMRDKKGELRHEQISRGEDVILKRKIGGINLIFTHKTLMEIVLPGMERAIVEKDNFDHAICDVSMERGLPIVVGFPSYVQHIGERSSMGHNHIPADVAADFVGNVNETIVKSGVYGRRLKPIK